MKVVLVGGGDSYRDGGLPLKGGKVQVSCSKQAAVATHHRAGKRDHAGQEALPFYCASSSRAQPPSNLDTSIRPTIFAIVTYSYRIIITATHPRSSMPFLHRDDAVLSFTNRVALSVEPPFADQLNRITTLEELTRNPPVQAAVDAERRAELFKEVLRT